MSNWAASLSREELLNNLDAFSNHKDLKEFSSFYLKKAVHDYDIELVGKLLNAGINP